MAQALALVADLKLGLYCKIKPKAMFICQSYGTALGAIVNYSLSRVFLKFIEGGKPAHTLPSHSLRPVCHQCQETLSGWNVRGSNRTVDRKSAPHLLFCICDLGLGRTCSFLRWEIPSGSCCRCLSSFLDTILLTAGPLLPDFVPWLSDWSCVAPNTLVLEQEIPKTEVVAKSICTM